MTLLLLLMMTKTVIKLITTMIVMTMTSNEDAKQNELIMMLIKWRILTTFNCLPIRLLVYLLVLFVMYKSVQSKPKSNSMNHFPDCNKNQNINKSCDSWINYIINNYIINALHFQNWKRKEKTLTCKDTDM